MHEGLRASRFGRLLFLVSVFFAAACNVSPKTMSVSPWDGASGATNDGGGSSSGAFGGGDSDSCQPGSVATYRPDPYHAASGAAQGACVAGAAGDPIAGFYEECLDPATRSDAACNTFSQTYPACVACILTPETATKYGPILDHGGFVTANVAGCLELAGDEQQGDASELPCAKAVQALAGCELAACEANCPVDDGASLNEYDACSSSAAVSGCESYDAAAACEDAEGEASAFGAACVSDDFQTFYDLVVPVFCGPPAPADGGASTFDAPGEAALSDAAGE
jgi:hypothetical protein